MGSRPIYRFMNYFLVPIKRLIGFTGIFIIFTLSIIPVVLITAFVNLAYDKDTFKRYRDWFLNRENPKYLNWLCDLADTKL